MFMRSPLLSPLARAVGVGQGGLNVRGYHVFNLLVHVLSAVVLFALVRRTLRLPGVAAGELSGAAPPLALVTAALWLVHPLQTDAVTYTIQRTELLMGFFALATLYTALRAFDSQRAWPWELASVLCCALGMLSKEGESAMELALKMGHGEAAEVLSQAIMAAYRKLVYETDGFTDYFFAATPIREIAELNLGSRPASRKSTRAIEDLRAEVAALLKENITIRRFVRYELGG